MRFSAIGLVLVLVVLAPNLLWALRPPVDAPPAVKGGRPSLPEMVEGLGRCTTFVLPMFLAPDFGTPVGKVSAGVMIACAIGYYAGWVRYFAGGRRYRLLFAPMFGMPVPMAVLPVAYFGALAAATGNPLMITAATLLGVGHIPVSHRVYKGLTR